MKDSRCIPIEELARVRVLPAGAPEHVHAGNCPRCRAALLALAEFERGDEALPEAAGAEHANARLDAVIESLTAPATVIAAVAAAPGPRGAGWLERLLAPPALRFAAGFAVVAIVAAAAWLGTRGPAERLPGGERVERGESRASRVASLRAVASGWELAWPAVEGAESYDVAFLDRELREVARISDVRGTQLTLSRDTLPAGVAPGVPLLVEIVARAGGGVLQRSVPAAIRLE